MPSPLLAATSYPERALRAFREHNPGRPAIVDQAPADRGVAAVFHHHPGDAGPDHLAFAQHDAPGGRHKHTRIGAARKRVPRTSG